MAKLKSTELRKDKVVICFSMNKSEAIGFPCTDKQFMVLPAEALDDQLTIGELGNSFRLMLPRKFLRKHEIDENNLPKKAHGTIFKFGKDKYLIVRISESKARTPR